MDRVPLYWKKSWKDFGYFYLCSLKTSDFFLMAIKAHKDLQKTLNAETSGSKSFFKRSNSMSASGTEKSCFRSASAVVTHFSVICFDKAPLPCQSWLGLSCVLPVCCVEGARPSNALRPSLLCVPVWPASSHHCCSVFGWASRASMDKGRRAVCAQPGHLAAQRGRGMEGDGAEEGGQWEKRDVSPPLSPVCLEAFCCFGSSFLPTFFGFYTLFPRVLSHCERLFCFLRPSSYDIYYELIRRKKGAMKGSIGSHLLMDGFKNHSGYFFFFVANQAGWLQSFRFHNKEAFSGIFLPQ